MAKIRLRFDTNEIEIDSRDFYIDNDTAHQVITELVSKLQNSAKIITESTTKDISSTQAGQDYLGMLNDVEIHEPEFAPPKQITADEIPYKIEELQKNAFFTKPRTVSETVERLHEYGWTASPLDVSKTLAKLAFHRQLVKESQENKAYCYKVPATS